MWTAFALRLCRPTRLFPSGGPELSNHRGSVTTSSAKRVIGENTPPLRSRRGPSGSSLGCSKVPSHAARPLGAGPAGEGLGTDRPLFHQPPVSVSQPCESLHGSCGLIHWCHASTQMPFNKRQPHNGSAQLVGGSSVVTTRFGESRCSGEVNQAAPPCGGHAAIYRWLRFSQRQPSPTQDDAQLESRTPIDGSLPLVWRLWDPQFG